MTKHWKEYRGLKASSSYDPATALSLALICQLAYEKKPAEIRAIASGWGFEEPRVHYLKKTLGRDIDTSCVVLGNDKDVIVAFTGSESANDWLSNFQASYDPGPMKGCNAHEGFQDALYPIVMSLTDAVQLVRDKQQRVWLTGHSLGGALCLLYAGMRLENKLDLYGVYTFGSPRPANEAFAEKLKKTVKGPLHRVVNIGDIVPHVPPEPFFSHPGNRRILERTRVTNSKASWWKERVDALKYFVSQTGFGLKIADPHILNASERSYIPKLLKDANRPAPRKKSAAKKAPGAAKKSRSRARRGPPGKA